jgi:predicted helicase
MTAMAFDEVFDRLYFSATSEHDKGSKFEELLESYLQTEPKYADQFSKVWRWQHWPGRAGRVDTGIDLVAEDRYTGELVAIQAKFYDPERKLEKHHIDSFFTELGKEPFARGMIVSSTDQWSSHAEAASGWSDEGSPAHPFA